MQFLTKEEIKKELKTEIDDPIFEDWFFIVEDILANKEFQVRKLFKHHTKSVWDHSIEVSFKSYKLANKIFADERICAIAGLLHDFYPYAWQYSDELKQYDSKYLENLNKKLPLFKKHGFAHAKEASKNYLKYFNEYKDKRIYNSILRHMFPLNIIPPRYLEGWIITIVDKVTSIRDTRYIISVLLSKNKNF